MSVGEAVSLVVAAGVVVAVAAAAAGEAESEGDLVSFVFSTSIHHCRISFSFSRLFLSAWS